MSELALLQLSAKAARYQVSGLADDLVVFPGNKTGGLVIRNDKGGDSLWNPMSDDGDAFRLAIKLHINIEVWNADDRIRTNIVIGDRHFCHSEKFNLDSCKAARRAIVISASVAGLSIKTKQTEGTV